MSRTSGFLPPAKLLSGQERENNPPETSGETSVE
jgi:hypothetical protein